MAAVDARPENEAQVKVRFVTARAEDAVTDAPIAVPVRLRRYGLSEVVNHLLGGSRPRPFHFLVEGRFLLGSLQDYLDDKGLSSEQVITLEYVEAVPPPEHVESHTHDDWVSAIANLGNGFVTASYDGRLRLYTAELEPLSYTVAHDKAATCLAALPQLDSATRAPGVLSGGQDESVNLFEVREDAQGKAALFKVARFAGHRSAVCAVAVSPAAPLRMVSGAWDGQLKIWDVQSAVTDAEGFVGDSSAVGKRRKVAARQAGGEAVRHPLADMNPQHTGAVQAAAWPTAETLYSASMDHTVRQWDMQTGINTSTMTGQCAVHSLAFSKDHSLIVTGHADKAARLWDPRVRDGSVVKQKFASHQAFISGVSWLPSASAAQFVTSSHDKSLKIWDVRALQPLFTVKPHEDRALCVEWVNEQLILSGGADAKLVVTKPNRPTAASVSQ